MQTVRALPRRLTALMAVIVLLVAGAVVAAVPAWPHPRPAPEAIPATEIQQVLDDMVGTGTVTSVIVEVRDGAGQRRQAPRSNQVVWAGGSGVQDLDSRRPVDPGGHFRVGSVTKTFVSTVVLQLVEDGKLALDDSVERHLPGMVPGGGRITVRQLLNHTSGLFDYAEALDLASPAFAAEGRYRTYTPEELVAVAAARDPYFAPGAGWRYSNTNYILAGLIIEKLTGSSWRDEVQRRILDPLGLESTSSPGTGTTLPDPHAHAYLPAGQGELVDITDSNPSWAGAAGDMVSTNADLNRFYRALLAGELLGPELLAEMKRPVATGAPGMSYGLGLIQTALPCGGSAWGHNGGINGFVTDVSQSSDGEHQLSVSATAGQPPADPTTVQRLQELSTRLAELTLCT